MAYSNGTCTKFRYKVTIKNKQTASIFSNESIILHNRLSCLTGYYVARLFLSTIINYVFGYFINTTKLNELRFASNRNCVGYLRLVEMQFIP